jgi:glycosyltransferase involved in cell wall biosynthesis
VKVLFLLYRGNPYCGGQGIYLYYLSRELVKLGAEIDVIVGPPYPDPIDEWATVHKVENLNIWAIKSKDFSAYKRKRLLSPWNFIDFFLTRLHVFPEMQTFSMRAFFLIRKLLEKKKYDIIHDINTLGWGNLPIKGFGIPVISTIHHPLTRDRDADLLLENTLWGKLTTILFYPLFMQRTVINRLDRIITSFSGGVEELKSSYGLKDHKVSVVYNGLDTEKFVNCGNRREENSLLFVGNTEDYKKGLIYLLQAMARMPERITLTIVDEGPPLKLHASDLVEKYNLADRITFTGKVDLDRLVRLYSEKTLLVMPSLYEGFGLPAVEAMSCSTPVVTTDAGALKEVVDDSCGIRVPPKDPEALKDAVMSIIDNKNLRDRMGRAGRKRAVDLFSWPVAAKNTYNVYLDVVDTCRGQK